MKTNSKQVILAAAASTLLTVGVSHAVPVVSDITMQHVDSSRDVSITYSLSEEAIVTLHILTNGVALPDSEVQFLFGDVNRSVPAGTGKTILWKAGESWPDHTNNQAQAELTAWTKESPPLYCAVDMGDGSQAQSFPLWYYTSSNAVPGGITHERYKTTHLLLRKIPPTDGTGYIMGSPRTEWNSAQDTRETQHLVILTNSFYIGVYELTYTQHSLLMGQNVNGITPLVKTSYDAIRGTTLGAQFPANDEVDATSIMGILRSKTSLRFDLPTEAQWEYACRAGTTTALNNGGDNASALNEVSYNVNNRDSNKATSVGRKLPNAFGLYDMHGNVWEWCKDWYVMDLSSLEVDGRSVSPVGPATGTGRIVRGGSFCEGWTRNDGAGCRSACRCPVASNAGELNVGLRLSVNLQ